MERAYVGLRRVCWDQQLVRQLFTTEADTKLTRDSFLRLHQPFDKIRLISAKPYVFNTHRIAQHGEEQFVSEGTLLGAFQDAHLSDPNRIFVLTGEPGSGKSHLARWLYLMLDERNDRLPIHIPRRINGLVGVLERLVDVANLQLDDRPSAYLMEAPVTKVVRYLLAYLDMSVGEGTTVGQRLPLLARVITRSEFESVLVRQVSRYQATRISTGGGTDLIMVPEEEFSRLAPGGTLTERTDAYATLRYHMIEALRKVSNIDRFDLKGELERISRTLVAGGKRPVLILEDITSFDLLHDDLLTFLLDESAGHFDALVCWTNGFEKAYLRTYQLDRYTARLSLSSPQMEVYSLQHDGFLRLVKGYLDVVKPWCKPGVCDLYERCVPAFEGLYPFNRAALEQIYSNLLGSDLQQRKTPRNLLDRAVKSYLELAEGHGVFPPLHQPPVVKEILYPDGLFRLRESHPSFVALAGWYGTTKDEAIRLNAEIPRLLGVTIPDNYLQNHEVVFPIAPSQDAMPIGETQVNKSLMENSPQSGAPSSNLGDSAQQVEVRNRMKELRLELQSWMASLKVPPHDHELLRGIHKLLGAFKLRLPVPLGHPAGPLAGVTYGKAQGESNLTMTGTRGKTTPCLQLMLLPADPAALGRDEEIWQAALEIHLTGHLPQRVDLALLAHWCHRRHSEYQRQAEEKLETALGMSLEKWVLAARWMLISLQTGITQITYAHLVGAETPPPLDEDLVPPLIEPIDLDQLNREVERLFHACFTISSGFFDAPRILRILERTSPVEFLPALANITHSKLDTDYRISMTTPFRDTVRLVKHVATAILQGNPSPLVERTGTELTMAAAGACAPPQTLNQRLQHLRRLIGLTGRYDLYDPRSGQIWDQESDQLTADGSRLVLIEQVRQLQALDLWEYLGVAEKMLQVRKTPGYRAALAAAQWAAYLQEKLPLQSETDLVATLDCAASQLQTVVHRSQSSIEQALHLLEEVCRENQHQDIHQAIRLLRERLLA